MKSIIVAALACLAGCQTVAPDTDAERRSGIDAGHALIAGGLVLVAAAVYATREDDEEPADTACPPGQVFDAGGRCVEDRWW